MTAIPTNDDTALRERAGGSDVIAFMEANGFKLTVTKENDYGFWFNESNQMTIGLPQTSYMFALIRTERQKAFKQGQRVGQYQAADKLYGDVTSIYLFADGGTIKDAKLKRNAADHAEELLKDCEKYMNHNRKTYEAYLKTVRAERQRLTGSEGEAKQA